MQSPVRFRRFSRKGYALFAVVGREVLVGTLTVATLSHAKAEGISTTQTAGRDTMQREELRLEEVVVTGSRAPIATGEAARIVSVITRDDIHRAAAQSVNDVLKMATGVDVRQRGGFGIQTDISIGGGTFDQIAVLLNGVNISNPQTGHLSADFPVSLDDILRIEVIQGAASRIYGASAFNGAINIVTSPHAGSQGAGTAAHGTVNIEGGSYGTFGASTRYVANNGKRFANSISAGYRQSDGGTDNSYFRQSRAFYQGSLDFKGRADADIRWQLGLSTKRYGANTFYSAAYPDQYESNARIFASFKGQFTLGRIHFYAEPHWNRSYDHFQLIRNSAKGENFHRTDVLGASLNASADWKAGRTSVGADIKKEVILSTNLGVPMDADDYTAVARHEGTFYDKRCQRTDLSLFIEHNVVLSHVTISAGMVANRNTGYCNSFRFYPGIDIGWHPTGRLMLTASWNTAFRMPTFTDLFYKSPTQQGNIGLKPEKTQSTRIAAKYSHNALTAKIAAFYDHRTDMIDWVMYSADDIYHSANFCLENLGFEVNATLNVQAFCPLLHGVVLQAGYAYISQQRNDDTYIYKSNYAMEYLRHKFTATLSHPIVWPSLTASWSFRWQQRMGSYMVYDNAMPTGTIHPYTPFSLLDLKLQWQKPRYELWLTINNLTSYRYYDLGNVRQPGLWLMAGAKLMIKD